MKMCSYLLVLFVTIFLQVTGEEHQLKNHLFKRSPQQIDIQSIRQKQLTPEITVVDVVVNEPARRGYPNQNRNIQPVRQQPAYPGQGNYYPNFQYQNVPNRRQPEIQIIEVVDPRQNPGNNYQQPQRYPQPGQNYPIPNGGPYPNNPYLRGNKGQFGNNGNGRPRRPYRPNSDFFIQEVNDDDDPPPRRPHHHRRPGHRGHRPRPPRPNASNESESSEEEKYVFDAGEGNENGQGEIAGYTKDNFPIIPLHKNDIRR